MERREFLKLCSVGVLLSFGPLRTIAAKTRETFFSEALGFAFKYPTGWQASTLEEQISQHISGESLDDDILPVVILSRFPEPTPKLNQNFYVIAYEPWGFAATADDLGVFEAACKKTVVAASNYLGDWTGELSDLSQGIKTFRFSYKALSRDGLSHYRMVAHLWYNRPVPLAFIQASPIGEGTQELESIINSLTPLSSDSGSTV